MQRASDCQIWIEEGKNSPTAESADYLRQTSCRPILKALDRLLSSAGLQVQLFSEPLRAHKREWLGDTAAFCVPKIEQVK